MNKGSKGQLHGLASQLYYRTHMFCRSVKAFMNYQAAKKFDGKNF